MRPQDQAPTERPTGAERDLATRVGDALLALGAPAGLARERGLPLHEDATELVVAHRSNSGREHLLIPPAAASWQALRARARDAGVELVVISGFRSFARQLELLQAKRAAGEAIERALRVMAPPGCSEHHTGRAVDIGTPGCEPLSESFEATAAFVWLTEHAGGFGFALSYPRGNPWGFSYEPWHWCWRAPGEASAR